jgi:hypothetical protein
VFKRAVLTAEICDVEWEVAELWWISTNLRSSSGIQYVYVSISHYTVGETLRNE